jgi:hypothetical protein
MSKINALRQYTVPPFVTDEGRIEVRMRNSFEKDGKRYGDCYIRWVPTNVEESGNGTTPSID